MSDGGSRLSPHVSLRLILPRTATDPDDLSKRLRLRLMDKLQVDQPTIFLNPVLYDGRAIMFTKQNLKLGPKNVGAQEVDIALSSFSHAHAL